MFFNEKSRQYLLGLCIISLVACQKKSGGENGQEQNPPAPEMIQTPYGKMASDKVITSPSGSRITVNADGSTTVTLPDSTQQTYNADPTGDSQPFSIAHEWLTSAHFYTPEGVEVTQFYGNIVVPGNPSWDEKQVLYYFTGVQDNGSPHREWGILQPVLGYMGGEWTLASWFCCPTGFPHRSKLITGIQPGDTIYTSMIKHVYEGRNYYEVTGEWKGQRAVLVVDTETGFYNWPNVTLEVYDVDQCIQFAVGEAVFYDLALYDQDGKSIPQTWQVGEHVEVCGNNIEIDDSGTIKIAQVFE